jgi:hypothetical protein
MPVVIANTGYFLYGPFYSGLAYGVHTVYVRMVGYGSAVTEVHVMVHT